METAGNLAGEPCIIISRGREPCTVSHRRARVDDRGVGEVYVSHAVS